MNRLRDYPVNADAGDLFRGATSEIVEKWEVLAGGLCALSEESGIPIQDIVSRQIADLGMSYLIAGDAEERPWPLAPMPLVIGAQEWEGIERGLIQRARLLEEVAADIYGPQRLVKDGLLPAAAITGSMYFARNLVGLQPSGNHYIHVYAVDLARGPEGQWRILSDRLRLANGVGYALENRLAMSRGTGALLHNINTRRLAHFFSELREGIGRDCQREDPRIALLTPGRFNQSYPEQAHLARYLGFPLVEGRDLTVSEDRLYVRTIAGPKRLDAVWRWIDTNALDPLTFDANSAIGVPDLFDAWARGGLEMANWPGVEVLESPTFSAFLPRLSSALLGEDTLLPNVATWWCGQPDEAQSVRERLDELVITAAFGEPVEGIQGRKPVAPARLGAKERERLLNAMERRPMDYCGQEIVHLSTTPALIEGEYLPRPFTLRAFVARGSDGEWIVMPGGFARISASDEISTTLMGEGDFSADVCVVDRLPTPQFGTTVLAGTPSIRRGGGFLASQAADNLYWLGRYCERAEATVRITRSLLGSSIEVDVAAGHSPEVHSLLAQLLHSWGAISAAGAKMPVQDVGRSVLTEKVLPGGVVRLIDNMRTVGLSLRDRLAPDFWRLANRPVPELASYPPGAMFRVARDLVERFSALSGMIAENLVKGPTWRFLDLGRRIERALSICRMIRQLCSAQVGTEALNVLLDLCDSQITYRSRYLAGAFRDPVLDLLLLDPENPRSLVYQLQTVQDHIEALPRLGERQLPEQPQREARAMLAPFLSLTVDALDANLLEETEARLLALSEAITARYFLQYEKSDQSDADNLLA